jgi:hypothetical protein
MSGSERVKFNIGTAMILFSNAKKKNPIQHRMVVILFPRIEIVNHVYNAVKWVPVAHTLLLFYSKECHNFSTLMKLEKKKSGCKNTQLPKRYSSLNCKA